MKYIVFIFSVFFATMAHGQASGHITTIVAGQTFNNYSPVFIASDGKAYKASVSDAAFAPVGIAIDTANAIGDTIQILHRGIIFNYPYFSASKKIYLGSVDGAASEFAPSFGSYYEIGRAVNGGLDLLVDIKAAGVSGVTRKNKTANESRVSSTTLTADNTLTAALVAGATYNIKVFAQVNIANANMDYKYSTSYGGTAATQFYQREHIVCGVTTGSGVSICTTGAIPSTALTGTTLGLGNVTIEGTITTTTAGTWAFNWAQNTSDVGQIIVLKGSYIEIERIQ
jgi:hypothetical protein